MGGFLLVNKLRSVMNKSKSSKKQAPVPVKIVYDEPSKSAPSNAPRTIDKYDAQDALRTLQRAREIESNKPLMRAAKAEAKAQIKALSSVK